VNEIWTRAFHGPTCQLVGDLLIKYKCTHCVPWMSIYGRGHTSSYFVFLFILIVHHPALAMDLYGNSNKDGHLSHHYAPPRLVNGPLPLSRASTHNILEVFHMAGWVHIYSNLEWNMIFSIVSTLLTQSTSALGKARSQSRCWSKCPGAAATTSRQQLWWGRSRRRM
jgi:hypothetical protein